MKNISIKKITNLSVAWLILFDLIVLITQHSFGWILMILGFPVIILLPGLVTIMLLGARKLNLTNLLICFGISLLELILVGLLANYIPQIFEVNKPLGSVSILITFNVCIVLLLTAQKYFSKEVPFIQVPALSFSLIDSLFLLFSVLTVLLSILGTFRLNNGASNILSELCLLLIFLLILTTIIYEKNLNIISVCIVIFSIGLSILLMTSLRSWDITGHDVKTEYMVYTLTVELGKWSISNYRNAYNACLSITILPVVLTKLLNTSGLVVFKFIFQIFFAFCPIFIFELLRNYISRPLSILGSILFTTFITFVIDSAMLTRQEIAYVFFALVLILWFKNDPEKWISKRIRLLFCLSSLGIILSHYSTAYMYIIILIITYLLSKIKSPLRKKNNSSSFLTLPLVLIVLLVGFFWYAQATQTSSGLISTLRNSIGNITTLLQQDNRSAESNYSIIGAGSQNGRQILQNYLATTNTTSSKPNKVLNSLTFYGDNVPVTALSNSVKKIFRINIVNIVKVVRGVFADLYQVTLVLGIIILLLRKKIKLKKYLINDVPDDYVNLCIAGLVVIALEVLLPNISLDYGLSRAFQQGLIFFSLPIIVAIFVCCEKIKSSSGLVVTTSYVAVSSAMFTGLVPQLTGGLEANLNLNNYGEYYGTYYVYAGDLDAFSWASKDLPHNVSLQASDFATALAHDPRYPFNRIGILPSQLLSNSYVLLTYYQVKNSRVYIDDHYQKYQIGINLNLYRNNRSLIYDNGEDNVYGPAD